MTLEASYRSSTKSSTTEKGGYAFTSFQVQIPQDLVMWTSNDAHYVFNGAICYEGNNPQSCHFVNLLTHNGLYIKVSNEERSILAKEDFNERLQNLNWKNYFKDLPFNPSALSLYKWAPIAEELKSLDRKIVLNSMILKWDIIKQEFEKLIEF